MPSLPTNLPVDRPTLLRLAAAADADPRTVAAEMAAQRGERPHVRGRAGERIRGVLSGIVASTGPRRAK